jgi:DNA-binding transcriptional ArsR family regulator
MVVRLADADLDQVLRALADGTRRDIVRRTLEGEASVSSLAAAYAMSFAAVQKHVAVLEAAGLVTKTPVGRERIVRAVPEQLARARACLEQLEALWRHRLAALDDILAEDLEPGE